MRRREAPLLVTLVGLIALATAFEPNHEDDLMNELFKKYNYLIMPIKNRTELPLQVRISVQLTNIIDVNEKDQVLTTNIWVTMKWYDYQMRWKPLEHGMLQTVRVAPDKVWMPEIVLFNNADGRYDVSFACNSVVSHDGQMLWVPPAIYRSSCLIDVEYFPYDEQVCSLLFGSWTYNRGEVTLTFDARPMMDISEYKPSAIWDLMRTEGVLVQGGHRIEFKISIRRKALFYTTVLIIPTVIMAFLSMAVFFLPTDSEEKITLTISILLSLVVFLLLVSKILPPTSMTIPLIAKYLLLTFVLNVITILIAVIIINLFHRGPTTHRMAPWIRVVFLNVLPILMCVRRSKKARAQEKEIRAQRASMKERKREHASTALPGIGVFASAPPPKHHPFCSAAATACEEKGVFAPELPIADPSTAAYYPLSSEAIRALDSIEFITEYVRKEEQARMQRDDWKFIGMILDRLLLYIFFGITVGGTCGIILAAPTIFENVNENDTLKRMVEEYKSTDTGYEGAVF